MHIDLVADLEAGIEAFMAETHASGWRPMPGRTPRRQRRYASDAFAQGMLLDRLESEGFHHEHLAALDFRPESGPGEVCHGSRLTHRITGRYVQSYHVDAGIALASAALMALRERARISTRPCMANG